MKICLIAAGQIPIPAPGWGGVEVLITNYYEELKKQGHQVLITNTCNLSSVVETVNKWNPDFVHLHYDVYSHIMSQIECKNKAITSHYPYIDFPDIADKEGYTWIYDALKGQKDSRVFALSNFNKSVYESRGIEETRVSVWNYGIPNKFKFSENPQNPDKTICLGKIEPRKRQAFLQTTNSNIDFAGPIADKSFWKDSENYLGTWSRDQVFSNLTNYANMVLLSNGESAPQVVYEALMAGLGLVVSKEASANLDDSLPFIDVVDNSISRSELRSIVRKNREASVKNRASIREYGVENFELSKCVKNYIDLIKA